jgi:two-component system, chemotaxis family, chemotaxis protein CheY
VAQILIVDDSRVMRDMVVASLRADGDFRFAHAASGLEAIERLSLEPFDLVVLDLNMPDIGGIEVLEFIRGHGGLSALGVLVLTSRDDERSRNEAVAAGANRFMTKPFEPALLLDEVRGLLDEKRGGA